MEGNDVFITQVKQHPTVANSLLLIFAMKTSNSAVVLLTKIKKWDHNTPTINLQT